MQLGSSGCGLRAAKNQNSRENHHGIALSFHETTPFSEALAAPFKTSILDHVDTLPGLKARDSIPGSTCNAGWRQSDVQSTGVFRLRVSLGDDPQTFGSHVFGSVPVPQVVGATPAGQLHSRSQSEKHVVLMSAFQTELRRAKEPVYLDKVLAVPQGLICHLAQQFSACGIPP